MKPKSLAERGQALIFIALAAIGLVAIVGLAVDGSAKYSDRRHAQNAADAAVLAGALAKSTGLSAGQTNSVCPPAPGDPLLPLCQAVLTAAQQRTDQNGYDGDLVTNIVEIHSPPIDTAYFNNAPYTGKSLYVQVIITSYVNTFFARVIGINRTRNIVQAIAIAGKGGVIGDGAMIISYDPHPGCSSGGGSGGGSVDVSGHGTLDLTGGGIFVNSQETCGYSAPNCPTINITGGAGINSAGSVDNINQVCGSIPEKLKSDASSHP